MTISSDERDIRGREAAHWLVALEEEPDNAHLRVEFESWRAASPANAAAWAATSDVYDLMASLQPEHADSGEQSAHGDDRDAGPVAAPVILLRPRKRRRTAIAAAAIALAACIALVIGRPLLPHLEADYITGTAETRAFDLPDGSKVHLAPESALAVDFESGERRIRLIEGEAFLEVAPDKAHPFHVLSGEVTTTVLGTAFDVRYGERNAVVAVRHGRVGVAAPGGGKPVAEELAPGDWVEVDRKGGLSRGRTPPDEVGAWMQGQLVARDRPVSDLVDDLRRYYSGFILLADSAFDRRRVTGVYNLADPIAALKAITIVHGGTVHQITPWLLVVTGG